MNKLHNITKQDILVPKEGQRGLLCSNKESFRCPSLCSKERDKKLQEIRPILKSLISNIIEIEINKYINNLYEEK
jgi:hypothetical protein